MRYCMGELSGPDATDRPQEQKVAICLRAWRERNKKSERDELCELLDRANALLEKAGFDPAQLRDGENGRWAGEPGKDNPTHFTQKLECPKCGHSWTLLSRRFK